MFTWESSLTCVQEITSILHDLKKMLTEKYVNEKTTPYPSKEESLERIELYLGLMVTAISRSENVLKLPVHGTDECMSWKIPGQKKKCLLLMYMLGKAHHLLKTSSFSNKRDIYYEDVSLWGSQTLLDETVVQLTRLLRIPRHCINIRATSKGLVAGSLTFLDVNGKLVDCRTSNGVLIPDDIEKLSQLRTTANIILVIEKDSTFQKLIDDQVEKFVGNCILITGKGYPDINTRRFLRRLWEELQVPPLALVDADPHGIYIMASYRYGSQNLERIEHLATPQLRYVGLQPSDIESLRLPNEARLPLTARDRSLLVSLSDKPFVTQNRHLHEQILKLRQLDCKAELQGLTKISPQYLVRNYLPSKLRALSWI